MTQALFSEDPYLKSCEASVEQSDESGVVLDRTVFYPLGGGQPGDSGWLVTGDGERIRVADTRWGSDGRIIHRTEASAGLEPETAVTAELDWDRRYRHMRMHTSLHLLGSLVPFGVTGGNISESKSRLDFDTDEIPDKDRLTAELNALIEADHPVLSRWISQAALQAQPELIRTMSVKPPTHVPDIRLLDIPDVDLQPCGGTHVRRTGEIGRMRVSKIENKGKHNRRVNVVFD